MLALCPLLPANLSRLREAAIVTVDIDHLKHVASRLAAYQLGDLCPRHGPLAAIVNILGVESYGGVTLPDTALASDYLSLGYSSVPALADHTFALHVEGMVNVVIVALEAADVKRFTGHS
jgi:hypothetical protein